MEQPPAGRDQIADSSIKCVGCGHNLTGATIGSRCPECGIEIGQTLTSVAKPVSGWSVASLVLGIISIPGCACYALPALVCGGLAIAFWGITRKEVAAGTRGGSSMSMATAGLVCGIIGLTMFLVFVAMIVMAEVF